MVYTSEYPIQNITTDVLVYDIQDKTLHILMVQRLHDPFKGMWAFPGGFINSHELVEDAAVRELAEETSIMASSDWLDFLTVASHPNRDPRGRTISIVYSVPWSRTLGNVEAGDDAADARMMPWCNFETRQRLITRTDLAFDHYHIGLQLERKLSR